MTRFVPLATCLSIPQAVCLRSMLDAYGIATEARTLWHAQADWSILVALGGVVVGVPETEFDTARDLSAPLDAYVDDLETEPQAAIRQPLRALFWGYLGVIHGAPLPSWVRHRRFKSEDEA